MISKNLLIISPKTYNYHNIIIKSAEKLDYKVEWIDDRPFDNLIYKIISRYLNFLGRKISIKFYIKRIKEFKLRKINFETALVIKGESVHPEVIKFIKKSFPNIKLVFYYWDSFINVPNPLILSKYFDKCITFDLLDAKKKNWKYIPLFAGNISGGDTKKKSKKFLISFVGVFHSDRLNIIGKFISNFSYPCKNNISDNVLKLDDDIYFFFYLYFPSLFHRLKAFLKNPIYYLKFSEYFHALPLDSKIMSEIYKMSNAVLDINHPSQFGFTMRTYETLCSKKKLITTNYLINKTSFFDKSRIKIINRKDIKIDKNFLFMPFLPLTSNEINSLSPRIWLANVLD